MIGRMNCPHCGKRITQKTIAKELGTKGGKVKSEAKAATARANGQLGGRPKGSKNKPKP